MVRCVVGSIPHDGRTELFVVLARTPHLLCAILSVDYKRILANNWKQVAEVMVEIGFLSSSLSVRSQLKAPTLRSAPGNRFGRLGFAPTTDTFGRKEERKEV